MKKPFALAFLLTATAVGEPIFDGETLDGWSGDVANYYVEGGVLHCSAQGRHLYTDAQFSDFRFTFDFRLSPGANSGIGIRTPLEGDPAQVAVEVQLLDDSAEKWSTLKPWQYTGSFYGIKAAERGHLKPQGEWNRKEILAVGDLLRVTLNGQVINGIDLATARPVDGKPHLGMKNRSGHLGILGHGDASAYRDLHVTDLGVDSPEGYRPLVQGGSLEGWASEDRDAHWTVAGGEIRFDGKGKNLVTEKHYTDFDLRLEYKIPPGGDSGIYLRGTPQVQIWDPENVAAHAAGADRGSGGLWNNRLAGNRPLAKADKPAGEWNALHIRMLLGRVTVFLNGQLVVENAPLEPYGKQETLPAAGPVELQAHGTPLAFRNLRIRELR